MRRFLLIPLLLVCCSCQKQPAEEPVTYRALQVELGAGNSSANSAGDAAWDYLEGDAVGYATDAGDAGTASVSREGPARMCGSLEVGSKASRLWCFTPGAREGVSVPARVTRNDPETAAQVSGMVFCTNAISLSRGESVRGTVKPLTAAVVLDVVDSRGKWTGASFSSVTIQADGGNSLAGDISVKLQDIPVSEVKNGSASVSFSCTGFQVGTLTEPASLGAVVLPCSFTGTVTVEGENLKAVYTVSQPLALQAGYVKHIQVDLARADVEGEAPRHFPRRLGIIGDSISTFEGIIPSDHRPYYTNPAASDCDVTTWEKTYWGQLITQYWNCELDVNTSWSGSSVASGKAGSVRTPFVDHSRLDLFKDPDCVILFGGTNDAIDTNEIGLGEFCYDTPLDQVNHYRRFRDAYIYVIRYLQQKFPGVQIICIIGTDVTGDYGTSVEAIAKHYNLPYVDFRADKGAGKVSIYKGSHPDAAGHAYKARRIYEETLNLFQ